MERAYSLRLTDAGMGADEASAACGVREKEVWRGADLGASGTRRVPGVRVGEYELRKIDSSRGGARCDRDEWMGEGMSRSNSTSPPYRGKNDACLGGAEKYATPRTCPLCLPCEFATSSNSNNQ